CTKGFGSLMLHFNFW
nr:immunoglobulin heavy chain junction region [Macaca mulatta]